MSKEIKEEKKSTGMTILIITAITILIIALFYPYNSEPNVDKLNKISYDQYQTLLSEAKDNLILIARPTCGFCVKFIPILEEIVDEYGIVINYFDTDTLSTSESKQFYESDSLYSSKEFGTPTLIITNNSEITKYSIGYKEKAEAVNWLKENGIIVE
ncbi:MAG: thioredoxin family protein [Bacilli bacterium]|nr:thioredoxin family protein [Bacilli bacterium]